ncbi:MAG: hypothetical protein KGL15_11775 [Acidobacteriota bacterium]|nr:hypothetical protein [Acidobacteriota bacterium]
MLAIMTPEPIRALLFNGRSLQSIEIGSPEDRARHKPPPTTPFARWAPPCPAGHPQRPTPAIAHRDKLGGLIQLRAIMHPEDGICSVVIQESRDLVLVRVILCRHEDSWDEDDESELFNCPVRVWLDEPLDDRWIIDVETGLRLPHHESRCL